MTKAIRRRVLTRIKIAKKRLGHRRRTRSGLATEKRSVCDELPDWIAGSDDVPSSIIAAEELEKASKLADGFTHEFANGCPRRKGIIRDCLLGDLQYKDASVLYGVKPGTARSIAFRARRSFGLGEEGQTGEACNRQT